MNFQPVKLYEWKELLEYYQEEQKRCPEDKMLIDCIKKCKQEIDEFKNK